MILVTLVFPGKSSLQHSGALPIRIGWEEMSSGTLSYVGCERVNMNIPFVNRSDLDRLKELLETATEQVTNTHHLKLNLDESVSALFFAAVKADIN